MTTWSSGDYSVIGTTLQIVGETLAEACDVKWDERVLDIAAGNGNATLAAARRGAQVTSTDYVPSLLERGAERAQAERLNVTFKAADAEALPFEDQSFDVVVSTFGAMFSPDHKRVAAEMARVARPSARIGLCNWTPEGFIGELFKTLGRRLPPPAGLQSPALWGVESHVKELFAARSASVVTNRRFFNFRYRSAAHFIQTFRNWYGPLHQAFKTLSPADAAGFESDLTDLLNRHNRAGSGSLVVPSEYLEVIIVR
ncbi:MAG: class I SAM-dependent methyltransferase [Proteobacteria bacterium]|nr:class I SAM-dependent methyltransferase [Pseudomonadota bacterium]